MLFRIALFLAFLFLPARAETIKIGILKVAGAGPVFIAEAKGYFAALGLAPELVYFDSAQPIAVATMSGDVDVGAAALTAGFYSLAGNGAMRVVGGLYREAPSFQLLGYVVTNRAFEAGLRSFKDLAGHSIAVTQIGSSNHYAIGLLAEKYGFDLHSVRVLALQGNANIASAVVGGQTDAAVLNGTASVPILNRGQAKLLGWVGDETPWQMGGIFVRAAVANERRALVERFLTALRKGARDYYEAYAGPDGRRRDGTSTDEITTLLTRYVGLSPDEIRAGIPYIDPELRLDTADVLHQIAWYKSEGLIKGPVDGEAILDRRYAVELPKRP